MYHHQFNHHEIIGLRLSLLKVYSTHHEIIGLLLRVLFSIFVFDSLFLSMGQELARGWQQGQIIKLTILKNPV